MTTRRLNTILISLAATTMVFGSIGCAVDDSGGEIAVATTARTLGYAGDFADAQVSGSHDIYFAGLRGDMAQVRGLSHVATIVDSYSYGYGLSTYVTVDAGDGRAAMVGFDLTGDFETAGLGEEIQVDENYTIGCAGPEAGVWDYDKDPDDIDVVVTVDSQDPEIVWVEFDATFSDYDGNVSSISGVIEMARPDADSCYDCYYGEEDYLWVDGDAEPGSTTPLEVTSVPNG